MWFVCTFKSLSSVQTFTIILTDLFITSFKMVNNKGKIHVQFFFSWNNIFLNILMDLNLNYYFSWKICFGLLASCLCLWLELVFCTMPICTQHTMICGILVAGHTGEFGKLCTFHIGKFMENFSSISLKVNIYKIFNSFLK